MKILKTYRIIALVVAMFTLVSACQRTELCYDHYPKANLSFDWEQEWERDYGKAHSVNWDASYHGFTYDELRPATPEWINLIRFRDNIKDTEHYLKPDGGEVVIKEKGNHSFLLYNGDTEYIIISDIASVSDARASATPRSRGSLNYIIERHPDTRSANPPDVLYSAYIENVPQIPVHQANPLPVKMQPLVFTYVVRYEFEYGLQHIIMARGALAGMAESVYLRSGRTSDEPIIILYDCDIKDYGCEAHVHSFGVPGLPDDYYGRAQEETPSGPFTLNLELMLSNGTVKEFNFDVADQLRDQPRGGVITVSGIRVEDEENKEPAGDFEVDLSGWNHVDIDFPIDPLPDE